MANFKEDELKEIERLAKKSLTFQLELYQDTSQKYTWVVDSLASESVKIRDLVIYDKKKKEDTEAKTITIDREVYDKIIDFIRNLTDSKYYWGNINETIKRYMREIDINKEIISKIK